MLTSVLKEMLGLLARLLLSKPALRFYLASTLALVCYGLVSLISGPIPEQQRGLGLWISLIILIFWVS